MNEIFIGGVSPHIKKNFHIVRFVNRESFASLKAGNFLIGSIHRNRNFDDARGDKGESSVSISLHSPDGWSFQGAELKRYIGMDPGVKFTGLKGSGKLTLQNISLFHGNPLSLSLSMIPKCRDVTQLKLKCEEIRQNLGMPVDVACVLVKNLDSLIEDITREIRFCKNTTTKRLISMSGPIKYVTREINTTSVAKYKQKIDLLFYSGILNVDYIFIKAESYRLDNEFRVIWIGHAGPTSKILRGPLKMDINPNSFLIVGNINFEKHFLDVDAMEIC